MAEAFAPILYSQEKNYFLQKGSKVQTVIAPNIILQFTPQ